VTVEAGFENSAPPGSATVTVAVLATDPATRSSAVIVWYATQSVIWPGISWVLSQTGTPVLGSDTSVMSTVTLPVFVTVIVYLTNSPTSKRPSLSPSWASPTFKTEKSGWASNGKSAVP